MLPECDIHSKRKLAITKLSLSMEQRGGRKGFDRVTKIIEWKLLG